ncbi:MAG: type IV toxin-antitoxin system AbiEi family antitoxin [Candidatus Micrarchaeota archaeon]
MFVLEREENQVFTIDDARKILGTSDASVKNVLKRLKKKRRVISLQKGAYLFAPLKSGVEGFWSENAFKIVPYLVKTREYYIGFIAAMNYWGMTEQIPITVHIAIKKQKRPVEAVQTKFVFVTKKRLGDFTKISFTGTEVNISSVEQTILDALAFPEYCTGIEGATKAIWYSKNKIDWKRLVTLAKNDSSAVQRRLGFLLELLKLKKHAKKLENAFGGFSWLDYGAQKKEFEYSNKWGLKVNVEKQDLLEFQRGY